MIFDKAEKLTPSAQDVFEKYLEDGSGTTKVIFICNEVKFSEALKSRFTKFEFEPIADEAIRRLISEIAQKENLEVSERILQQIISKSEKIQEMQLEDSSNTRY